MRIALVGYGKMGRMIEAAARARGHEIAARIDPFAPEADARDVASALGAGLLSGVVAVEFTKPDTALANIRALAAGRVPVVVGTTGWHAALPEARAAVEAAGSALLWSANFSLGVNFYYKIAECAARLFDQVPEYDVGGFEAHHNKKADSPSGTAVTLVERVLAQMTRKKTPVYETLNRPPAPAELHFPSLRVGAVPGTHSLFFDSVADTIELTHVARNREGFALGAVRAAEWLSGKTGVFTMDDVLSDLFSSRT
jgi:4-hydroxy-tetrahydrodipicolinate reductase